MIRIRGVRVEHFFGLGWVGYFQSFSVEYPKISGTRKCLGTRIFFSGTRMSSVTRTSPGTGRSSDI